MKKVLFLLIPMFFILSLNSCTDFFEEDETIQSNEFIDPEKECPEWDRCNCNGIPDADENVTC